MTAETVLAELEALHSPARGDYGFTWPRCDGCDMDGFEAESPAWPCRTAAILWPDPDEQAALLADWHEWADPLAVALREKYSGRRESFVPEVWSAQLSRSLEATSRFLRPKASE